MYAAPLRGICCHVLSMDVLLQRMSRAGAINMNDSGDTSWLVLLLLMLLVGLIVVYIRFSVRAIKPFRIESSTTLDPDSAVDHITI